MVYDHPWMDNDVDILDSHYQRLCLFDLQNNRHAPAG
jgi:hypothetical protein